MTVTLELGQDCDDIVGFIGALHEQKQTDGTLDEPVPVRRVQNLLHEHESIPSATNDEIREAFFDQDWYPLDRTPHASEWVPPEVRQQSALDEPTALYERAGALIEEATSHFDEPPFTSSFLAQAFNEDYQPAPSVDSLDEGLEHTTNLSNVLEKHQAAFQTTPRLTLSVAETVESLIERSDELTGQFRTHVRLRQRSE